MKPEEMRWLTDGELQLYNFNNRRQLQYDTNVANALEALARCRMLMEKAQAVLDRLHQKTDCLDDEAVNLIDELAAELDGLPRGEDVKE